MPGSAEGWSYYSSNASVGRIQVVNNRLRMDTNRNGTFSVNEAIWQVDLAGASTAELNFFQADFSDEAHSMPAVFTGHAYADGVAVSNDGVTWYRALPSSQLEVSSNGQNYTVDLDALVNSIRSNYDAGFGYQNDFYIKFQQYDNYSFPTDGREWADINITANFSDLAVNPIGDLDILVDEANIGASGCEDFQLTNIGNGPVNWTASTGASWLTLNPDIGAINNGDNMTMQMCWTSAGMFVGEQRQAQVVFSDGVGNSQAFDVSLQVAASIPLPPFTEDFSAGMPTAAQNHWSFYSSTTNGRIQVANGRLAMDVNVNGSFSLNEAVLKINLGSASNVLLSFFQLETSDEIHTMPSSFTGHHNSDGVAISMDGVTWYRVINTSQLDSGSVGQNYYIDLDAEVARIQSTLNGSFDYSAEFFIKFQQYDNYRASIDGRAWDNISVSATP